MLGQVGLESKTVILEMGAFHSKSVFNAGLERGRLQHGNDVLESSLRRSVDEIPSRTPAMLHITFLERENTDSCVGPAASRRTSRLTSPRASSNETGVMPEERSVSFALMMSSVSSEISMKPVPNTRITSSH